MTLASKIDKLAAKPGIEAVAVDSGIRMFRSTERWHDLLRDALNLFGRYNEPRIRLVIGKHTVVVQREGDETAAVVMPTGHPIAKSLRRMICRAHRSSEAKGDPNMRGVSTTEAAKP